MMKRMMTINDDDDDEEEGNDDADEDDDDDGRSGCYLCVAFRHLSGLRCHNNDDDYDDREN